MSIPLNFPTDKLQMASTFRAVLFATKRALDTVTDFRQTLYDVIGPTKADIKAALVNDYGFTVQEADDQVESLEAEYALRQVAIGQAEQVGQNDFFFTAKKVWGYNQR